MIEVSDCSEQFQFLEGAIETCRLEVTLPSGMGRCDSLSFSPSLSLLNSPFSIA